MKVVVWVKGRLRACDKGFYAVLSHIVNVVARRDVGGRRVARRPEEEVVAAHLTQPPPLLERVGVADFLKVGVSLLAVAEVDAPGNLRVALLDGPPDRGLPHEDEEDEEAPDHVDHTKEAKKNLSKAMTVSALHEYVIRLFSRNHITQAIQVVSRFRLSSQAGPMTYAAP